MPPVNDLRDPLALGEALLEARKLNPQLPLSEVYDRSSFRVPNHGVPSATPDTQGYTTTVRV